MAQLIVLPVTSRTSPQPVPTLCLEGIQNISLTVISKIQASDFTSRRFTVQYFNFQTSDIKPVVLFFLRLLHSSSNLIG